MEAFNARKYLLLDPRILDTQENVALVLGQVTKEPQNPLFIEDKSWEVRYDNLYANVIFDQADRLFKCWYNPFIMDEVYDQVPPEARPTTTYKSQKREMGICYATSRDGVAWEKPDLGIIEFNGSSANNIVLRHIHGAGVYRDLHDPDPQRRYKAFMREGVATSADGLHWSQVWPCSEIEAMGDTHNFAFWEAQSGKYVGITRLQQDRQRIVGWTASQDFLRWSKAGEIMRALPEETHRQTYALLPFAYAGIYLGLLMLLHMQNDTVDCELAWSTDTLHWERVCPGQALIPRGAPGSFDRGCIYGAAAPMLHDGRLLLYYGGGDDVHGSWRKTGFGLARLRPDGFAGMAPAERMENGVIVTKPVICTGNRLQVSADAAGGFVQVTLLHADGSVQGMADPVIENVTDGVVHWPSGMDLSSLQGQPVRLKFELQSARLYAFGFGDAVSG